MEFVEDTRLLAWLEGSRGLGPAVVFGIGLMPPLAPDWIPDAEDDPPNYMLGVRACNKYCGLDVQNGSAPRRKKDEFLGYDTFLKSVWIYRVTKNIECQTPNGSSGYRAEYDARKAHTRVEHPPMLDVGECECCDKARRKTKIKGAEHK